MKLVVGLGNPGAQYSGTRHNVGFEIVNELGRRWQAERRSLKFQSEIWEVFPAGQKVLLVMPLTYMNRSGDAVRQVVRFYQAAMEDLVVICDDVNLPAGQLRWRASGSAGGQNGLQDILKSLGTTEVPRLRVGIGRPPGQQEMTSWVLGRFRSEERDLMDVAVQQAADSVEVWVAEGIVATMNRYNRAAESAN